MFTLNELNELLYALLELVRDPRFWWQFLALTTAAVGASLINRRLQAMLHQGEAPQHQGEAPQQQGLRHIAMRGMGRLAWPFAALACLLPLKGVLDAYGLPHRLVDVAVPMLMALALIRLGIYLMRKAFPVSPLLKSSEGLLVGVVWVGAILHIVGWLPNVLAMLDAFALTIGELRVSVLSLLELALMVVISFTLAIWLSDLIARKLSRNTAITPSLQVGFAKFSKFFLVTLAFLIALNAVGINLNSLAIFGGALGVGIGFGLQRIASNFISGFILVLDRSIKPGDVITIGQSYGWVQELNARYVVVRNRQGVDTLIPNENLITSEVINWSYADRNVRMSISVQCSYGDDPEVAMAIMQQCAFASPRVLHDPVPAVRLIQFADSGIMLELRVWIADPEGGSGGVKSDINLAIWRAFKEAGITIPYPQRDIHIRSAPQGTVIQS